MQLIPLFDSYALRPLCPEDAAAIFQAIDAQREYLGRWLPFVAHTLRPEQTRQVVAEMLANTANPIYTLRDGEHFAGLIGFKSADREKQRIEIGYWLCEQYQKQGLMTAAVKVLCTLAFEVMDMRRVEIRCAVNNTPSNRIPQRLGFRLDRVELNGEELTNGVFTDLNLYINER